MDDATLEGYTPLAEALRIRSRRDDARIVGSEIRAALQEQADRIATLLKMVEGVEWVEITDDLKTWPPTGASYISWNGRQLTHVLNSNWQNCTNLQSLHIGSYWRHFVPGIDTPEGLKASKVTGDV